MAVEFISALPTQAGSFLLPWHHCPWGTRLKSVHIHLPQQTPPG